LTNFIIKNMSLITK